MKDLSIMRSDIRAIGGFFEDLPVLAFVLTGSFLVMWTNVWVVEQQDANDVTRSLEEAAEELADAVLKTLSGGGYTEISLESVRFMDPSSFVPHDGYSTPWAVSIVIIHPFQMPVSAWRCQESSPEADAGWHSRLFNVRYGASSIAVAEVVAVVYSDSS